MQRFVRVAGVRIEPIGDSWVAFSPTSGETLVLNDESAAILEVLELGTASIEAVSDTLAADSCAPLESLRTLVRDSWPRLVEAGLVRQDGVGQFRTA